MSESRRSPGQGQRKTSAAKASKRFEIAERRRQVALMLRAGWQQKDIAEALGVSEGTVSADKSALEGALRAESGEAIATMVAEESAALDADEATFRELLAAAKTPYQALQLHGQILAIMQWRSQLLGLDSKARERLSRQTDAGEHSPLGKLIAALEADGEGGQ